MKQLPSRKPFPRTARLLKHAEFETVYKQGKRHFSTHLTAFYLARAGAGPGPRVGLTVSRALGGAVERNRIRRRMRAAVREHLSQLAAPVDVVINPKKSALQAEFQKISEEVARAFAVAAKSRPQPKGEAAP